MIIKLRKLAVVFGAVLTATQAVTTSAAEPVKCTIGKQTYQFLPFQAGPARVRLKDLEKLDAETKSGYTQIDSAFLKSENASKVVKKAAISCGSTAFLKLGDIDLKSMKGLKITGRIFSKDPWP